MSVSNNFLTASRFTLTISGEEFKDLVAQVQEFNHPGIRSESAQQSARRVNIPQPGAKIQFEPLTVRVLLDNKMVTYKAIYDWLVDNTRKEPVERDLTLTIYNLNENPTETITYRDAFPTDIGQISFSTTDQNDTTLGVDVTFAYSQFTF